MHTFLFWFSIALFGLLASRVGADQSTGHSGPVTLMYLTGQHDVIPENEDLLKPITHVVLAFLRSDMFTDEGRNDWPLFRSVSSAREAFVDGTKILVAIGGWGDVGFSSIAQNDTTRKSFAQNVARMVQVTGADGIDIDWEYPGGNGEDYKQVPNSDKEWEIEAYTLLLGEIRAALGSNKLMTAAVPGLERDMLAFTPKSVPRIMEHLDYLNVMTYDLMNRRDTVTKHHSSVAGSRAALQAYASRGAPAEKLILGLGFYVKWFRVDPDGGCAADGGSPVGCKTLPLEDPETGADLGNAGGFSWHDQVPEELRKSFQRASVNTSYDFGEGATYHYDAEESIWWTYDEGRNGDIASKIKTLRSEMNLGGVFAWGLGEDGTSFRRLAYLIDAMADPDLPGKNEAAGTGNHQKDEL